MKESKKKIILIGFMASGKSTVGKELAKKLNIPHRDTDLEIIKKEQTEISEIFNGKGEEYFRRLEEEIFSELLTSHEQLIISTGGGLVLSEKNRKLMEGHCIILLETSIEEIYNRVSRNKNRPLLNTGENLKETISRIYQQRKSIYINTAKSILNTSNKSIKQIVEELAKYVTTNCINN